MTVTGFFVCVIFVGAYLAVCYEDSDKRKFEKRWDHICLLYTSPSPRDGLLSRMPSSA